MRDGRYYLGVALLAVAAQFAAPGGQARTVAYLAIHLSAAAALFAGVARHRPSPPQPWLLLGAALVLHAGGLALRLGDRWLEPGPWMWGLRFAGEIAAALAATTAVVWFVVAWRRGRGPDRLLDAAMVPVTALLAALGAAALGLPSAARVAAPVVVALILVTVVAGARLVPGAASALPSLLGLLGAVLLLLVGNLLTTSPELSRWADLSFLASSVLVGSAALHSSMARLTQPERVPEPRVRPARPVVLGWALLVGPLLVALAPSHPVQRLALAAGTAVLVLLVQWRVGLVMAQREQAQAALARSERRYRTLMQHAFDAIAIVDSDGAIQYASPALGRLAGSPDVPLAGTDVARLIHPEDAIALRGCLTSSRLAGDDVVRTELRLGRSPMTSRWADVFLVNRLHDPSIGGIVMNLRDVTEHKQTEIELSRLALQDSLTGLPNRHALLGELEDALRYQVRRLEGLAVLFADLDGFKAINDHQGHAVGDQLLVKAARRLHGALRPGDVLARFGGDEFVVLALGVDNEAQAIALAKRLRQSLSTPISCNDTRIALDITVGVALTHRRDTPAQHLLDAADMAMYRAKREGIHIACHRGLNPAMMGRDLTPIPR